MEKMYPRKAFKCSICNKEYENAMDRARCELACGQKQEEAAKKAAEAKKKAEQMSRHAKVDEAYDLADKLRDEYVEDYGVYVRTNTKISNMVDESDVLSFADLAKMFL